jgi:hypothetical protein
MGFVLVRYQFSVECFVHQCLYSCHFYVGWCIICPSSIYCPFWYLQAFLNSILTMQIKLLTKKNVLVFIQLPTNIIWLSGGKTVSNHSIKAENRTLIGWSFVYIKQFAGKIQNDRVFPQKQQRNFRLSSIPDTRYSGRLRKFKMAGKRAGYLGQQLIWRKKSKLFCHLSHIIT